LFNFKFFVEMKIEILSGGCAACSALFESVKRVVAELGLDATVEKVEDFEKIMAYNVMSLPALVIDGAVVAKGRLSESEIKKLLTA
jgi:small redox-active disulfide protein 2